MSAPAPSIYASLLTSDVGRLAEEVAELERAETIAGLHVDVDGGVTFENAHRLAGLGADMLVVGSALFAPPSIGACAARFASLFREEVAV